MKLLKYALVLPVALSFIGVTQAKGCNDYTVPFQKVEVQTGDKIYVDYNFSSSTQYLVCSYDEARSEEISSVEWEYKGATRKLGLPITLLDHDSTLKNAYYADSDGELTISNDFGSTKSSDGSISVSCEYHDFIPADISDDHPIGV